MSFIFSPCVVAVPLQPPGSATAPTSSSNFGRISNTSNLGPAPVGSTSAASLPPPNPPPLPSPAALTFNPPVLHRPLLDGERSSDDTVHHSSGFHLLPYQGGCRSIKPDPSIDLDPFILGAVHPDIDAGCSCAPRLRPSTANKVHLSILSSPLVQDCIRTMRTGEAVLRVLWPRTSAPRPPCSNAGISPVACTMRR